jgi:hypothetical protein
MNRPDSSENDRVLDGQTDGRGAPVTASDDLRHALRLILWDSLASEAMGTLTTGVFLVGLAVALDASNFMIGVLAAIPFFVQLLQVPAVLLIERIRCSRSPRRSSSSACSYGASPGCHGLPGSCCRCSSPFTS